MRLPFQRQPEETWQVKDFVWLENASERNIMLHLPSGELRLDMKRRQRFRPDILDQPQVKELVDSGQIVVQK
ncbi:MAG: hypothetical protein J5I90_08195 [Caldilineales bacterium]|nr:hypothetical protein [Caldilineales bacterium]